MRKINNNNNKFRGNTVYSLNYKFDSVSAAGKVSGTALDLIKKYNELAKEAQGNGNYVEMEVFRQYAEHYRKIVTEINERKNQNRENQNAVETENKTAEGEKNTEGTLVETEAAPIAAPTNVTTENQEKRPVKRRSLTVVEVSGQGEELPAEEKTETKPRRRILSRKNENAPTPETAPADAEGQN